MDRHITLPERLSKDSKEDWLTMLALSGRSLDERVSVIRQTLAQLFSTGRDDITRTLFVYYVAAIHDEQICPLIDDRGRHIKGQFSEYEKAVDRARGLVAKAALEIWAELPGSLPRNFSVFHAQDHVAVEKHQAPTLEDTRRDILTVILERWRDTRDEEEATLLFKSFLALRLGLGDSDLIKAVLRKVTNDRGCYQDRLTRHINIALEGNSGVQREERLVIAKILGSARSRGLDFDEFQSEAVLDEALLGASERSREAVKSFVREIRIFDDKLAELVKQLWNNAEPYNCILPRGPAVSYLDARTVEIKVRLIETLHHSWSTNDLKERFDRAVSVTREWLKSHALQVAVILELELSDGFHEPSVVRKEIVR